MSLSALGVFGFVTLMLRRQRFVVSRIATRLEIREGDEVQSLFVREVKDVEVRGTFAVVCVLTDGRRVAIGERRMTIEEAFDDQRRLLEALE